MASACALPITTASVRISSPSPSAHSRVIPASSLLPVLPQSLNGRSSSRRAVTVRRAGRLSVSAESAKLPAGVKPPPSSPNLPSPLFGFTTNAEVWNSRASMIGLFALVALEAVAHAGLLELLGVEVGKGLNIPL
eukprot:TRINITY_DN23292_c0_g1_i1.p2 TRINITY_DN23292_c0_g1~~TRINITY_DN23292_c0_g1_i1.p2  ORF type:complete len:135 (+),score=21.15 TRINITY_DN23292_c0_g1_i1:158-562(+)